MLLMKDLTTLYMVMGEGDLCGKKKFFFSWHKKGVFKISEIEEFMNNH